MERWLAVSVAENEAFQRASAALQAGRFEDAERSFKAVLRKQPRHVAALNLLGIALTQLGRFAEAETYLRKALNEYPNSDATLYNYGIVLKALNRHSEAVERFTQALTINPAATQIWHTRGLTLSELNRHDSAIGDFDKAVALSPRFADALYYKAKSLAILKRLPEAHSTFEEALALRPDLAEAWCGLGNIRFQLKQHDEALAAFAKALAAKPDLAEAWLGRGNVCCEIKQRDDALAAYDKASALRPNFAEPWLGRGNISLQLQHYDEALSAYDRALALKPDLAAAWLGRGCVFSEINRYDEASAAFDQALALQPDLPEAWVGRGNIMLHFRRYPDALAAYDKALALKPDFADAWLGRGNVFSHNKREDEAFEAFDKAVALKPDFAEAWVSRGNVFFNVKFFDRALADYDKALSLNSNLKYMAGRRLYTKLQMCDWTNLDAEASHLLSAIGEGKPASDPFPILQIPSSPADQLQCAKRFMEDQPAFPPMWRGEIYAHDRIRVAYLSADFREHPVAYLIAGLFEQHDKSRFEVTGLSFGPDHDSALRKRIKGSFEHFIDVGSKSDQEIAGLMRELEIDIAVDLMGFTQDNRFNAFAARPAPVQVNYLGYPGTMGAGCIDYIVADSTIIPENNRALYSEKVIWLPESYQVNDSRRDISQHTPDRRDCGLPDDAFVFCCFNNSFKLAPGTFRVWMNLLRAVDDSVLWLSDTNSTAKENLLREAASRGVAPGRVIFAPKVPSNADHLARHRQADLFLDTLPYNAHTTASDALWAGLPVLTQIGETFAGRVAASLLAAIGLPDLITTSAKDYEDLAVGLAANPEKLAAIKRRLAENRQTASLFDTQVSTRRIEAAYQAIYQRYQKGLAPDHIRIAP
jgi:protein O-GlcNAc transferase